MKNFLKAGILLLFVVVATGCGAKKLTCTQTETESGMKMKQEVVYTFKSDKVNKANIKTTMVEPSKKKDELKQMKEMLESSFETMTKEKGIELDVVIKGNDIIYTMNIEIDKIAKDKLDDLDMEDIDQSFKELKKQHEDNGFKCK